MMAVFVSMHVGLYARNEKTRLFLIAVLCADSFDEVVEIVFRT